MTDKLFSSKVFELFVICLVRPAPSHSDHHWTRHISPSGESAFASAIIMDVNISTFVEVSLYLYFVKNTGNITNTQKYWVQMWKSYKQRYWYHLCIECNCVQMMKQFLMKQCFMIGERCFDNVLVTNCIIVLKRRYTSSHSAKVAIAWNEMILEWWWKDDDQNDHHA